MMNCYRLEYSDFGPHFYYILTMFQQIRPSLDVLGRTREPSQNLELNLLFNLWG